MSLEALREGEKLPMVVASAEKWPCGTQVFQPNRPISLLAEMTAGILLMYTNNLLKWHWPIGLVLIVLRATDTVAGPSPVPRGGKPQRIKTLEASALDQISLPSKKKAADGGKYEATCYCEPRAVWAFAAVGILTSREFS